MATVYASSKFSDKIQTVDVSNTMTKHGSIWEYVRTDSLKYYKSIIQPEGLDHFLRAATAKILWISFWYIVATTFIPIRDFFILNATVLFLGGGISLFWDGVIKDHAPKWFGDIISGEVFFEVDIKALNRYICTLFVANVVALIGPEIWKNIKTHE